MKKTSQFIAYFIKDYNEESDMGYSLESDLIYAPNLHNLNNVLAFLSERKKIEKLENLVIKLA